MPRRCLHDAATFAQRPQDRTDAILRKAEPKKGRAPRTRAAPSQRDPERTSYRLLVVVARLIVTRPIRFVLVWWISRLPSAVARMCRIVPTPDGIAQL